MNIVASTGFSRRPLITGLVQASLQVRLVVLQQYHTDPLAKDPTLEQPSWFPYHPDLRCDMYYRGSSNQDCRVSPYGVQISK